MSVKITNNTSAPIEVRVSCRDCGHAFYDHDEDGLCAACLDLLDDLPGGAQGARVTACPSLDPDLAVIGYRATPPGPADLTNRIMDFLRRHPELLDELSDAADDIDNDERGLDFVNSREPS